MTNAGEADARPIGRGAWSVFDFIEKNLGSKQDLRLASFEGEFTCLWTVRSLIALGDRIFCCYPNTWSPFDLTEELSYVDANTLKVIATNGLCARNEPVTYRFDSAQRVQSINYNGIPMEPVSLEKTASRS